MFRNYFLVILFDAFLLSFLSSDDNRKSADFFMKKIMQRHFERFFRHLHHYALCTFFAKI